MRLSKLKLAGFKTFVDPTTVSTPGGLVGVVGPNGCGKSNIIDAVRWVLGEMRASALRGGSMQDVIFSGAGTRKPVSRASVELVFDNSDGRAAGHWSRFSEIAVKRVLDRSGESSYHINNTRVRRKDVVDLFLGTGLGPKAYAIIEQGMISRIIEARPDEIRAFLEEAASVTRYRERRKETETRLRDAHTNLMRLDDVRTELGERLAQLEEQARIAQRYRDLGVRHDRQQNLLWLSRLEGARAEQAGLQQQLAELSATVEADSARLQELETACKRAREAHQQASDATHNAQNELFAAAAEVSRLESELKHQKEALAQRQKRLQELSRDRDHWQARAEEMAAGHTRWNELLENALHRVEQIEFQHGEVVARLDEAERQGEEADRAAASAQRELTQTEQQCLVEETRRANTQRTLDGLMTRHERLNSECREIGGPDEAVVEALRACVETLERSLAGAEDALERARERLSESERACNEAAEGERAAQRALTEKQAQHKALTRLQQQSRSRGKLGEWLSHHALDALRPLWQRFRVEPGWELALEVALGSRLRALEGDCGAATALLEHAPPEALTLLLGDGGDKVPSEAWPVLAHATPMRERLTDIADGLEPVLHTWLAGCFAVESVADWLHRRGELPVGARLIDPLGRALTHFELTQYRPDEQAHGAIARQREIDELEHSLSALEEDAARAQTRLEYHRTVTAEQTDSVQTLQQQAKELQQRVHAGQVELLKLTQAQHSAQQRRRQIDHDLEELSQSMAEEQERLMTTELEIERGMEQAELQRERLETLDALRAERDQVLRDTRAIVHSVERELQEARFSERECLSRLEDVERNRKLAGEQLQRLAREQEDQTKALQENTLQRCGQALEEAVAQRGQGEERLASCRDRQEALAARLHETEQLRRYTEQAITPLRERVGELRLALQAAQLSAEQYQQRLEEAGADMPALKPLLAGGLDEASLQREVTRLQREIQALGAVNLAAIDELESAQQRKFYLDSQHDDLSRAITMLEDAIRRIDRDTREQLQQTYDAVNEHLGTLFPRLFGGGDAALVMSGDEILDAGIQIVARPPGKKNSSIHLLSGGEKALTAIALVFAMFRLNPAPFCMLDEVDAPLDDANTERYCRLVRHMSSETQFIFISHNKATMEMAQQLVGVTMQEQGVSRIVAVDIEKALKMAQPEVA